MVRRVRDGRFGERPHYKPEELDDECESVIVGFLRKTHGEASFPVDTEDLKKEKSEYEKDKSNLAMKLADSPAWFLLNYLEKHFQRKP